MRIRLWLLLSLFVSVTAWLYMHQVLLPWEQYIDVQHGKLKAEMGDLYPRWVGTRELLLHGRNPYTPEVSHEIQMAFYGHVINQKYGEPGQEMLDEQRFAYPVYVVFLLAPTVHLNFLRLQTWAVVILAILTAVSLPLLLDVLHWRPPGTLVVAMTLLVLSSPQIAQGLRLRQLGLLVSFLLALGTWCIARNHLWAAGVALAVATIKPQMLIFVLTWFLLWAVSDWRKRWPLLAGFATTLCVLVGVGELILPGWLRYFIEGIEAYGSYFPTTSTLRLALGNVAGGALSVLVTVGLLAFAWRNRKEAGDSPRFSLTAAAFLIGTTLVLPLMTPFNQVLLLLPLLIIVRDWDSLPHFARLIFIASVSWPCIVSFALLLFPPHLDSTNRLPLLPSALVLFVPFIFFVLLIMRRSKTAQL